MDSWQCACNAQHPTYSADSALGTTTIQPSTPRPPLTHESVTDQNPLRLRELRDRLHRPVRIPSLLHALARALAASVIRRSLTLHIRGQDRVDPRLPLPHQPARGETHLAAGGHLALLCPPRSADRLGHRLCCAELDDVDVYAFVCRVACGTACRAFCRDSPVCAGRCRVTL